jgi:hypothetical protein
MKPVKIQLQTEGAQAAANEIDKVTAAADDLSEKLQDPKTQTGIAPAAKKTKDALDGISQAAPEVQRSTRNMGAAVLSLSQGIEDAQYGIRGVLNNIPSLVMQLGGTMGLAGVVSMAAVSFSVLGPKLAGLFAGGEVKDGAEEATEALEKLREKAAEVAGEKSAAALQEWLDALDDEEQSYRDQNAEIERQIELIRARRDAQLGVDTARRDAEIASIQADPKKDEATKIREVAAVREADEKARAKAKIDDLAALKNIAAIQAKNKAETAQRQKADADGTAQRLADLEAEKAALRGRVQAANAAAVAIEKQEAEIKASREKITNRDPVTGVTYQTFKDTDETRRLQEELARTRAQANSVSVKDRSRLASIDGDINLATSGLTQQQQQADAAAIAARDAAARAKQAAELEAIRAPAIRDEYNARAGARSTTSEAAAKAAEARAKAEADRKAEQASRAAAQAEIERKQAALDAKARQFAGRIDASGTTNRPAQRVADRLADGTNLGETESLTRDVQQEAKNMSAAMFKTLTATLKEMQAMAKDIENLQGQAKRNRTGK